MKSWRSMTHCLPAHSSHPHKPRSGSQCWAQSPRAQPSGCSLFLSLSFSPRLQSLSLLRSLARSLALVFSPTHSLHTSGAHTEGSVPLMMSCALHLRMAFNTVWGLTACVCALTHIYVCVCVCVCLKYRAPPEAQSETLKPTDTI